MTKAYDNSAFIRKLASKRDTIAYLIIFILALLSLRGAFYGIASPDESFYLTIPYRIIQGDALLVDEWHASQFSAFLLYLPMKLFMEITKSTDGIVLFFRCLFTLCQAAVSVFTYNKIKRYGFTAGIISAAMFMMYVPENVRMLDYYTMSLMGIHVSALLFFFDERPSIFKHIFTGIIFACAVTAQPFNSIIYFIYCATVLVFLLISKKRDFHKDIFQYLSLKKWFFVTVGIFICAAVFIAFLLSQASFSEIVSNFGNIFGGHDHTLPFSDEGKTDMFSYITIAKTLFGFTPVSFCVSIVMIIALLIDRNRTEHRKTWLIIALAVFTFNLIEGFIFFFFDPTILLFRPYYLFLLTFTLLLLKKERNHRLFCIWLTGLLYNIFLGIISQALDYIGVIGCVISNTALCPAAQELYTELINEKSDKKTANKPKEKGCSIEFSFALLKRLPSSIIAFTLSLCIINISAGTVVLAFSDELAPGFGREIFTETVKAEEGPLKGIHMTPSQNTEYKAIIGDIEEIKENSDGKVLIAGLIPWAYFCIDKPLPTFTAWYISEELPMFKKYFEDKEHIPSAVYIPETSFFWNTDYSAVSRSHKNYFRKMFKGSVSAGECGSIIYVNKIK